MFDVCFCRPSQVKVLYGGTELFDDEVRHTFHNDMMLAVISGACITVLVYVLTSFSGTVWPAPDSSCGRVCRMFEPVPVSHLVARFSQAPDWCWFLVSLQCFWRSLDSRALDWAASWLFFCTMLSLVWGTWASSMESLPLSSSALVRWEDKKYTNLFFKGNVWHFGKYPYFVSCQESDDKIDTALMSVHHVSSAKLSWLA